MVFDPAGMEPVDERVSLRFARTADELSTLEPLWNALQEHHTAILPSLGGRAPRALPDAWRIRRAKYERWLADPETFFVVAGVGDRPVGYAFVTVSAGYASWATGPRIAELETLSVLSEHRGHGVGEALLDAVWAHLGELEVDDLAITTALANVDSHRFYERHGFERGFVVYYGKRP